MALARSGDAAFDAAVLEARLEAVRAFAYGAGHEINNPLANIAARAQALLVDEHDPERRRKLATIVDQAFRARDMIGGLMVFARPPRPTPVDVDVREVLGPVLEAARPAADTKRIRLEHDLSRAAIQVWVDPAQVTEALRALIANALDAADEGGRVTVDVSPTAAGCGVSVADDGPGMDGEAIRRAFDPFYCGRDAGRGIGLGLPKALRLIETNGGRLSVDSRLGAGTRVVVHLPASGHEPG